MVSKRRVPQGINGRVLHWNKKMAVRMVPARKTGKRQCADQESIIFQRLEKEFRIGAGVMATKFSEISSNLIRQISSLLLSSMPLLFILEQCNLNLVLTADDLKIHFV
jgi:hypothetical protein